VAQQVVTLVMLVWGVYLIDDKRHHRRRADRRRDVCRPRVAPLVQRGELATRYQGARAAMVALDR
jgi:ATP-binding cassette, subfamily C, bacterial LapB